MSTENGAETYSNAKQFIARRIGEILYSKGLGMSFDHCHDLGKEIVDTIGEIRPAPTENDSPAASNAPAANESP